MRIFFGKIKSVFRSKKLIAGVIAIAALSLPFVINQVLKQQDIRQRANTAPSITFNLSPSTQDMTINQTINVDLVMNADLNDVGALHFKLIYDPTLLEVTELAQPTALQSIQKLNPSGQGYFEVVMLNPTATPVTGNNLKVFTFKFRALKAGNAIVKIDPDTLQATSQLSTSYLLVDNKTNITGSYTIKNEIADITGCNVATNKPNNCACNVDGDCASGSCIVSNNQGAPAKICATIPTATPTPSITLAPIPLLTPTQIPNVTLAPGETGLKLSLKLPGISKRNGENDNPIRTKRTVKVTVYDATLQNSQEVVKVPEKTGTVEFNPSTAQYEGIVGIGNTLTTGNYIVKVKMDNTLVKRLPGVVYIDQTKQDNSTPTVELVTGDLNQNNSLDVQDYTNIMACYNNLPACTGDILILGDLDDDGVTNGDNDDINIMQFNTINRQGD